MDSPTTTLATVIGARVRDERLGRAWTLDDLAGLAGVSRRMLVNVEQGAANPSIGTLLKISDALGIGLPALVEPPDARGLKVVRRGAAPELWSSDAGGRALLVAGTSHEGAVELWDWTLAAGDEHQSEGHSSGTRELLQVHQGVVTITSGGQSVVLDSGDAVTIPGDVAHSYANNGTASARFSLAVYEPGIGSATRSKGNHG